ncbi:MAG TPA: MarR family transcriptional regulator [Alphaproteobacteria bacterium]|nr:MarR family transcriptional regulator [Alphaproteobacteria bacterium]
MAKRKPVGRAKGKTAAPHAAKPPKPPTPAKAKAARPSSLTTLVTLTSRLFARALHNRLVPHGVAPGQLAVLHRLWEGDGITQAELARAVRVEQPTMARTLDRMARDGLIERVPSREDRRAFNVRLTARGRLLRRAVENEASSLEDLAVANLKRKDRQELSRLLSGVVAGLEAEVSPEDV